MILIVMIISAILLLCTVFINKWAKKLENKKLQELMNLEEKRGNN